ncbi:MAG TPA: alpha/beta fold hydrolase [Stellaceae bacterium]|nr:alpha/beta fold hydrolase [Stellaceae bacterium]
MSVALSHASFGSGPPLLILHGLFGSHGNWAAVARRLGEWRTVYVLDLRNHGASPWDDRMDYPAMAEDVAAFVADHGIARPAILGHSMGGKVAMTLALADPALLERLVVVDIAPVARRPTHLEEAEAMRSIDLTKVTRRGDADAQMRLRIEDPAVRAFLLQNLVAGSQGMHWRLNLEAIVANMAELAGFPAFPPGTAYRGSTLVVRGANSAYIRDADRPAFAQLFPDYRLVTIEGAGHWLHAERFEEFLAAVTPFLR